MKNLAAGILVLVTVIALATFTEGAQLQYYLEFIGKGVAQGNIVHTTAKAHSQKTDTLINPKTGVSTRITRLQGAIASFASTVTLNNDGTFIESGNISFGVHLAQDHVVYFETIEVGKFLPNPLKGYSSGMVLWNITKGEGAFEGASGYITSNFYVDPEGKVVDNQVGYIYVPDTEEDQIDQNEPLGRDFV